MGGKETEMGMLKLFFMGQNISNSNRVNKLYKKWLGRYRLVTKSINSHYKLIVLIKMKQKGKSMKKWYLCLAKIESIMLHS